MSTSLRPYYARTSPRHNYLADIRASAFEHQRLTKALKADLHCAEPQGRTSAQTHQPGLHCAGRALRKVERDGKRAATLAVVQTLDIKDFEETQARCHPRASATLSAPSR